jgi:DNA-directed RNA polymerase specialized sigma54-like protein
MATWPAAKKNWPRPSARFFSQAERSEAAALELLRRGIDLVQHLDPAGVGAATCASAC